MLLLFFNENIVKMYLPINIVNYSLSYFISSGFEARNNECVAMKNEFPDVRNMQIQVQENIDHFASKWSMKMKDMLISRII